MIREAMKQALEALELYQSKSIVQMFDDAVKALRQALETEQEPVAWASSLDFDDDDQEIIPAKDKGKLGTSNCDIPLYTTPPKRDWIALTDDEVSNAIDDVLEGSGWLDVARALEEVIKRKNT